METQQETTKPETAIATTEQFISQQLQKFEFTEEGLIKLVDEVKELKVTGIEDKEGLKKVHEGRMRLARARTGITKGGKALREFSNTYNKAVLERESTLVAIVSPTEEALKKQEDEIEYQKQEKKAQEQREEDAKIQTRIDALAKFDFAVDITTLKAWSEDQFNETLVDAEKEFNEKERKRQEEEQKKAEEREQLKKQKEAQEAERAELERKQREFNQQQEAARQENERKAKELTDQQDQLRKQQEDLRKQKDDARKQRIFNIGGLSLSPTGHWYFDGSILNDKELMMWEDLNDLEFDLMIDHISDGVGRMKKRKDDERAAEQERIRLKAIADQKAADEKRLADEAEEKRKQEEQRQERIREGSDANRFAEIQKIIDANFFTAEAKKNFWDAFTSKSGRKKSVDLFSKLLEARNSAEEWSKEKAKGDTL